jgi:hypothetical protein
MWSKKRSPGDMSGHLAAFIRVSNMIMDGLSGKRKFHWGEGERQAYTKKAEAMGVTLVTRNQIKRSCSYWSANAGRVSVPKPCGGDYDRKAKQKLRPSRHSRS